MPSEEQLAALPRHLGGTKNSAEMEARRDSILSRGSTNTKTFLRKIIGLPEDQQPAPGPRIGFSRELEGRASRSSRLTEQYIAAFAGNQRINSVLAARQHKGQLGWRDYLFITLHGPMFSTAESTVVSSAMLLLTLGATLTYMLETSFQNFEESKGYWWVMVLFLICFGTELILRALSWPTALRATFLPQPLLWVELIDTSAAGGYVASRAMP